MSKKQRANENQQKAIHRHSIGARLARDKDQHHNVEAVRRDEVDGAYGSVLAILRECDKTLWELGDALIEEIGRPQRGINDQPHKKLEPIATELLANGCDYSVRQLTRLRRLAHSFPERRRHPSLSWAVHYEARSPEILDKILEHTSEGQPITVQYVRAAVEGLRQDASKQLKAAHAEALRALEKAEAEMQAAREAKQKAKGESERKAAEHREREAEKRVAKACERVEETCPPPRPGESSN
jgi:hypothetical protein